jgi:hypothetical protein
VIKNSFACDSSNAAVSGGILARMLRRGDRNRGP